MPKLKHKLLRQELADSIVADLRKGIWQTKLPGLRLLAERYGVSKRTCSESPSTAASRVTGWPVRWTASSPF
jgi:DNA-binding GntR family transcriptional regulator